MLIFIVVFPCAQACSRGCFQRRVMFVSEPLDSFGTIDEYVHSVTFHRVTLLLIRGTFKDAKYFKQFLEIYSACSSFNKP